MDGGRRRRRRRQLREEQLAWEATKAEEARKAKRRSRDAERAALQTAAQAASEKRKLEELEAKVHPQRYAALDAGGGSFGLELHLCRTCSCQEVDTTAISCGRWRRCR